MKKLLSLLLTAIVLSSTMAMASTKITVKVNGTPIDLKDAAAYVDSSNRTLVPIRFIADNLGAETSWDNSSQTATVKKDNKTIEICIPCKKVTIDGQEVGTDSYGSLKNGRTYVPLRLIAEAFGAKVGYANKVVTIDTVSAGSTDYPIQDVSKMKRLDNSLIPNNVNFSGKEEPLYDGAGWNWDVKLTRGTADDKGFGITYRESVAGALYLITTNGEWIKAQFPFPGAASYLGNHLGKEIDKAFFIGSIKEKRDNKEYFYGVNYLVDIPNFIVEK